MRKWTIRIAICTIMGLSFGWFCYHEYIKSPRKPVIVSKQEKPIKIYTRVIDGRWVE